MNIAKIAAALPSCALLLVLACGGTTVVGAAGTEADAGTNAGLTASQACADNAHQRCSRLQTGG